MNFLMIIAAAATKSAWNTWKYTNLQDPHTGHHAENTKIKFSIKE
jgi:hypothetical protein